MAEENTEYLKSILEKIRTRLIDKTRRNRLLNYKESARDIAIIDEMPNQVFNDLIQNERRFYFDHYKHEESDHNTDESTSLDKPENQQVPPRSLPHSQKNGIDNRYTDNHLQTPYSEKELERRLRKLYLNHKSMIEETGGNNLYLAVGFLHWYDSDEDAQHFSSPLILLPVRLEKESGYGIANYKLFFDDETLDTNYSLYEKLRHDFDISLPILKDEHSPEEYWKEVDEAITPKSKNGWKVVREMDLGMFRFYKQVMWHDLDFKRWPKHSSLLDKKTLKHVLEGTEDGNVSHNQLTHEYDQDNDEPNNKTPKFPLIMDTDSTQYSALVDSLTRQTGLVIEGPPGTGKSQTISNLIASALDMGQSVLFVAEKMAALKVVFNNLETMRLGEFCLQLHGLKTNKKELFQSLRKRIERKVEVSQKIKHREQELELMKKELIEFSKIMSQVAGPEELQLFKLVWRVELLRQKLPEEFQPIAVSTPEDIKLDQFQEMKNLLDDLGKEWAAIPLEARVAWKGFLPVKYKESKQSKMIVAIENMKKAANVINTCLLTYKIPDTCPSLSEVSRLLKLSEQNIDGVLPHFPSGSDLALAHEIVHHNLMTQFDELLSMVEDFNKEVNSVNEIFDYHSKKSGEYVESLHKHSGKLINVLCNSDTTLGDIPREKQHLEKVIKSLELMPETSEPVIKLLDRFARTLKDYKWIAEQAERLCSGPSELCFYANPFHTKASVTKHLTEAKAKHRKLVTRASKLAVIFYVERLGCVEPLKEACQSIHANKDNWFRFFKKDYRKSKQLVKGLMRQPKSYSLDDDLFVELNRLIDYGEERDLFAETELFRNSLGKLFKGIETDWVTLKKIINFSQELRELVGIENAKNILSNWDVHADRMENLRNKLNKAINCVEEYSLIHPLPKAVWKRSVNDISSTLRPWIEKLDSAINAIVQPWCNTGATLERALDAVETYKLAKGKESRIIEFEYFDKLLSPYWKGPETPINLLRDAYNWLANRLQCETINLEILRWLIPKPEIFRREDFITLWGKAKTFANSLEKQLSYFKKFGTITLDDWIGGNEGTFDDFDKKLESCTKTISSLPSMNRWQIVYEQACEVGLKGLADEVATERLKGEQCGKAFELSVYSRILEEKVSSHPKLEGFSYPRFENLQERFAKLDKEMLNLNAEKIAARLCKVIPPAGIGHGRVKDYTETALLRNEAGKKKRHLKIRQLIRKAGNALQALKPCFLMSPLSTAQYLPPGEIEFDLVVMDEASQIRPEDAIGAIARGRKIVIVGDPNQLPPSRFFDVNVDEDEEAEETIVDDTESILNVCLKRFPYRRLRWHYRSQHESLIQFSNERFYKGDLIVFPSPKPDLREFGVYSTFVENPSYKNGRNRSEAEVVVQNIRRHYHRHRKKSLGVAAFNKKQAEEIQLLLDRMRSSDQALDELILEHESKEPLFIKNLENVQGDERDVIFISTTYGPEKKGMPTAQRFGPINSELGWRRLNVIATRAKQRVEVFTSMRPTDIRVDENTRKGVKEFRNYLEYAATGKVLDRGTSTGREPVNDFEEAVGKALNNFGYETNPQVGVAGFFIDIGVKHPDRPGEYIMGVECDGASYHSAKSVRDRDRLRQEILESKGWYIHRIWSTSWFHTRSAEIERLKKVLKKRREYDRKKLVQEERPSKEPEILLKVEDLSSEQVVIEDEEDEESLEKALRRFWEKNIKPQYPDSKNSILSDKMIKYLLVGRPETEKQWFEVIPMELRVNMDPRQKVFLEDILDIVAEYG